MSAAVIAMIAVGLTGCGPGKAREPNALRPIDEGRALKLIANTLQQQGLRPLAPQPIVLNGGIQVRMDVGVHGRELGIVYLTAADIDALKNNPLAVKPVNDDRLVIRHGEKQHQQKCVVVLYASDYMYDDNVGQEREATSITAENKLDRDVRDFLIIAKKNHWP